MHLTGCKDQSKRTLDEFFTEAANSEDSVTRIAGTTMLDLIARLRALPNNRRVFGLTSHYRLCLLAEDSFRSFWFVIITVLDKHKYFVEYLLPQRVAPWPRAYVKGKARSEDDAVRMIEIAMEKSEGWTVQS